MVTESKLNARQLAFCRGYVDTGNAALAYREAGYSENGDTVGATRLLANSSVKAEITRLRNVPVRTEASIRSHVLNGLWQLSETAKPDSARIHAHELLGKHARMFVEISESTVTHELPELAGVPLSELLAIRAEIARQQEQPQLASKQPVITAKALPVEETD